ncbi:MAG TPA: sulfotransferase [Anaerolineales bacterium]|nr:sulfotransferase [Anaerolineales bacterium]
MRNPTIICVTGMGRSGTSLVARVLDLLGASLGPAERLMGPAESNPKGHWEHQPIVELNDEILALFGGSWDEPPVLAPGWHRAPEIVALREKGRAITEAGFAGHDLWAWKDPRSSVTLPFWQDVLPPMKYIVCLRNPLDVAFSLRKRDGYPIEKSGRLWLTHLTLSIAHTSGHPRLLMFYEDLMDDWPAQVERLAAFIERPGAAPAHLALQSIAEFVDRELEHHRTPIAESLQEIAIPLAAQALHLMLRGAVHTSSPAGTNRGEEEVRLSAAVDVISQSCLEADARLGETEEAMADLRARLMQLMHAVEAQDLKLEALTREMGVGMQEKDEASASLAEGLHAAKEQLDERDKEIAAMVRSKSWRWTRPLRELRGLLRSLIGR